MMSQTLNPLLGIRILDFSTLLPGPLTSKILQDMGADVTRIESPDRLDLIRLLPPFIDNESASHRYLNTGKKSVVLDLKNPKIIEILKSNIHQYDIVIEQFRPGVMAKFGLDYDSLKVIHPGLIYCSISGYGQTGPLAQRAGHDINYLSLAGVAEYSRRKGEKPTPYSLQVADIGGSYHAVMAILAALYQRDRQGSDGKDGQYLDISLSDSALAMNSIAAAGALANDVIGPEQQLLNAKTYYDFYETKDGRYFSVGSLEPKFCKGLCEVIGHPELIKIAMSQEAEDISVFKQHLTQFFIERDFSVLKELFSSLDICVEPVLTLNEALQHQHFKHRGMIVDNGKYKILGSSLPFNSCNNRDLEKRGQSTREFLKQSQLSNADLDKLFPRSVTI